MPQLSFWSEIEGIIEDYRDNGEFPFDGYPTIQLDELPPEDQALLSKLINSPAEALEQQLTLLLERYDLIEKLEVRCDKHRVGICPVSI